MNHVSALSKAFALATPDERALDIRDEVAFFQAVRSAFAKSTPADGVAQADEMESAIQQLVSSAVASDEVVDIFSAAGLKTPDIGVLSDEFLEDVRHLPQKNLALEMLRKLLNDEIRSRSRRNVVQARSFAGMMEDSIRRYQNRTITTSEIVVELIEIAREMRDANQRGEELGLNESELAFYDALAASESAREVMGDNQLAVIALELVKKVKGKASIDWTMKESARAKMRVLVKRILRHYGYPPDLRDEAVQTVLEQAEALAGEWARSA